MSEKDPAWVEILDVVLQGFCLAVPLAVMAFAVHKAGWLVAPAIFLPLYCAYLAGRRTVLREWEKEAQLETEWEKEMRAKLMLLAEEQRRLMSGRTDGCLCQWEQGDSPCPVHGEDEES